MPNTNNKTFQLNYATFNDRKNENEHSLYVCDLSHSVTSEKLISFFKTQYNSVIGGKIIIDPSNDEAIIRSFNARFYRFQALFLNIHAIHIPYF